MWGRDNESHYCHRCEYSLTIGRPLGLGVPKRCVRRSVGSEKCGKGSSSVDVLCVCGIREEGRVEMPCEGSLLTGVRDEHSSVIRVRAHVQSEGSMCGEDEGR